jgi:hypothetical protein
MAGGRRDDEPDAPVERRERTETPIASLDDDLELDEQRSKSVKGGDDGHAQP